MPCKVYLIGAGPGDPELLTVKGLKLIEAADVIIYDYLANDTLLAYAKPTTKLVYVGKKGFTKHITQEEINRILVDEACLLQDDPTGRQAVVVRLKGGDPYVFGRGGEEALVLSENGIPFELVPGVTSGVAAPACAGIPVTHRGISTSVAFVTGNEDPTKAESDIDWNGIAQGAQTLCFYMGIKNLPHIAGNLIKAGKSPDTPVALIRWGTTSKQEELFATLGTVAEKAQEAQFKAPAIIVVGEVVALSESIGRTAPLPLHGKTVAVTRSRTQASALADRLKALGAQVLECPTIQIEPLHDYAETDRAIASLAQGAYDWLVLTSTNGVERFFERMDALDLDARALAGVRIAAIGPATASELAKHGIRADLVPTEYRGEAVAAQMIECGAQPAGKVLIARAKVAREAIPQLLREAGIQVDVVPLYETIPSTSAQTAAALDRILAAQVDAITFTSSSTASNFAELLSKRAQESGIGEDKVKLALEGMDAYSIGPVTSKTMREYGILPKAEAQVYTIAGLVDAIAADLDQSE